MNKKREKLIFCGILFAIISWIMIYIGFTEKLSILNGLGWALGIIFGIEYGKKLENLKWRGY